MKQWLLKITLLLSLAILFGMIHFETVQSNEVCDCFPHPSDWEEPEQHGLYAFDFGTDPECTECHGSDLKGGFTGVSCYSCHEAYPHTENWKKSTEHGVYAFNNGVAENCQNACHGDDFKGGYSEQSCFECHEPYPHNTDWADEEKTSSDDYHGNYVLDNDAISERTCASDCHGTDYDGGLAETPCSSCHEAYPHSFNWSRPDVHGKFAVDKGVEESCGIGCHGEDYEGGNADVSCYDCHANFPHESNYEVSHENDTDIDVKECGTLCHGIDYKGGLSGYSCTTCHDDL
jgi:hypothetical protein